MNSVVTFTFANIVLLSGYATPQMKAAYDGLMSKSRTPNEIEAFIRGTIPIILAKSDQSDSMNGLEGVLTRLFFSYRSF